MPEPDLLPMLDDTDDDDDLALNLEFNEMELEELAEYIPLNLNAHEAEAEEWSLTSQIAWKRRNIKFILNIEQTRGSVPAQENLRQNFGLLKTLLNEIILDRYFLQNKLYPSPGNSHKKFKDN